jgi:hypothetical protein
MWKISGEYVIWGYRDELLQEPEHEIEPHGLSELRTCAARDDLSNVYVFVFSFFLSIFIRSLSMYPNIQVVLYGSDASHLFNQFPPRTLPRPQDHPH